VIDLIAVPGKKKPKKGMKLGVKAILRGKKARGKSKLQFDRFDVGIWGQRNWGGVSELLTRTTLLLSKKGVVWKGFTKTAKREASKRKLKDLLQVWVDSCGGGTSQLKKFRTEEKWL